MADDRVAVVNDEGQATREFWPEPGPHRAEAATSLAAKRRRKQMAAKKAKDARKVARQLGEFGNGADGSSVPPDAGGPPPSSEA